MLWIICANMVIVWTVEILDDLHILSGEKLEVWGVLWELSWKNDTYLPFVTSWGNLQFFILPNICIKMYLFFCFWEKIFIHPNSLMLYKKTVVISNFSSGEFPRIKVPRGSMSAGATRKQSWEETCGTQDWGTGRKF